MPSSNSIGFPTQDVRAFFAQLERGAKELNRPIGQMLRQAGNLLGKTMGTSTNLPTKDVKAKKRTIKEVKGVKVRKGMKRFEVTNWRGGRKTTFYVIAANKREANKRREVRVLKFGLAKFTWAQIASKIGSAGSAGGATPQAKRLAKRVGKVAFRFSGNDPFVIMTNELSYALSALQGGENDVNTAMARAARGLSKSIDKQLARKLGAT